MTKSRTKKSQEENFAQDKIAGNCYGRWLTLREFDLNHFFMQGKSYRNIEHIKQSSENKLTKHNIHSGLETHNLTSSWQFSKAPIPDAQ